MAAPEKASPLPTYEQVHLAGPSQIGTNPEDLVPDYSFPNTFTIGSKQAQPFVNSDQLKAHLALLRVFYELRTRAQTTAFPQVSLVPAESLQERRWSFFVSYAVERFQTWCCSPRLKNVATLAIPPPEVLMVWHAYRLNPVWYAEDVSRVREMLPLAAKAGTLFESLVATDPTPYLEKPSEADKNQWATLTRMPFDIFDGIDTWLVRKVVCPHCEASSVAGLLKGDGTGYLQNGFLLHCPSCSKECSRENIGVAKFIKDALREDGTVSSYIAGTYHTALDPKDHKRGLAIKYAVNQTDAFSRDEKLALQEQVKKVGDTCQWSMGVLSTVIGVRMRRFGRVASMRVLSAYVDDRPFSVELVGAVLRQASFVEKMHKLRWTEPGYFSSREDEIALQHSIARYHAFLDLMSSASTSFFVPTLDIDLAWHTHQLLSEQYGKETRRFVGRFIDHDDKVEESNLINFFEMTCKAWQARFNVPYSLCGCPMPGDSIGKKLANRVSQFLGRDKGAPSHLIPPNRTDLIAGTHPSDHNGVVVFKHKAISDAKRQQYEAKQSKQQQKDALKKGEKEPCGDPFWGAPFLYPVPVYYTPLCAAVGGVVHAGCAGGFGGCGTGGAHGSCSGGTAASCGGGCGGGGGGCGGS